MTTSAIRKKLSDYLQTADDKKIKAIYTMVEDDINTQANDWDEEYITELKKRGKSFSDGSAKTYTWEETKKAAIQRVKAKKNYWLFLPITPESL
jgi:hypothetical protein